MARKYNFIYNELVTEKSGMVGHIAYSLYKAEKISFIEDYKRGHNGAEPTEDDFDKFHKACCSPKRLEYYISMARYVLAEFLGGSFDDMSEQVVQKVSDKLIDHIDKDIVPDLPGKVSGILINHIDNDIVPNLPQKEKMWLRYFHGVAQGLLGAIILPLLIGLILFSLKYSVNDIWMTLADFFKSLAQQ